MSCLVSHIKPNSIEIEIDPFATLHISHQRGSDTPPGQQHHSDIK